jgi:hypothetical protein
MLCKNGLFESVYLTPYKAKPFGGNLECFYIGYSCPSVTSSGIFSCYPLWQALA